MKTKNNLHEIDLEVSGMTCDSCALYVTKALRGVEGVIEVNVPGWKSGRAKLIAETDTCGEALIEAVKGRLQRYGFVSKSYVSGVEHVRM
ncbi:hypothetical protein LCGC14_1957430 [marine sediment metagenome]|uniref:HMA domain-containing protein n=1 Tax=marine sediment metagenome TaxID=412755 RepID=A0A0F9ICP4_9ZZZZ